MNKGFTIVEVSILFVIFLIVAFLVAPMSVDDTLQAKNISRWRSVQQDFTNILYSANNQENETALPFNVILETVLANEIKDEIQAYRITYKNGTNPLSEFRFDNYKSTYSNAVLSVKLFEKPQNKLLGYLMYDVNGKKGPNSWGKDVFGLKIYNNNFEPFGRDKSVDIQKQDCSKNGTGLYCSNYYLIGGNFD